MSTEIKFTEKFNNKINAILEEYATGMEDSHSHWAKNRKASKPKEDSLVGKKGEFFVSHFISQQFGFYANPDVKIYSSRQKNWDADLPYKEKNDFPDVHVKTCSQKTIDFAKTFSWTFQFANGNGFYGTDKLFASEEYDQDLIALVFVPTWESDTATLLHLSKWSDVKQFLADPVSPRLKGIKKCLYTNDLNSIENLVG